MFEKVLRNNARLTYEELLTVITEIELVLNSRTLTYLHFDDVDRGAINTLTLGIEEEEKSDFELLTRRQRH